MFLMNMKILRSFLLFWPLESTIRNTYIQRVITIFQQRIKTEELYFNWQILIKRKNMKCKV